MAKGDNIKKRKTVYEIVGENRPHFKRGVDPLDDLLLDEERELSREVKRIRLEQIVMKKRREIARMKEGGDMNLGPMASNADFMKMARMMIDLTPEEQQRVASAYGVLRMADRGQVGGSLGILGQLIPYARQNPGASEESMIKYLTLMDGQFAKGLELARAVNPASAKAGSDAMEFMKIMKDLVIEGVRNPVLQAIKENQPSPGVFEQILTRPELWSRAKEIGMFGGGNTTSSQIDIELEKLRGERYLQTSKWELEMRRDELKRQAEDRRTDTLLAVFGPIAASFVGPTVANRMNEIGQQQAAAHQPHNPAQTRRTPPPMAPQQEVVRIMCDCGYEGVQPLTSPPQDEIICPDCGQGLIVNIDEPPDGGN